MPIISHLRGLKITNLDVDPLCEVTVQCPSCLKSKTYQPTLQQLRNIVDDYTVHRNAQGNIVWVEGTTRLLTCPNCGYQTVIHAAICRQGDVLVSNPGEVVQDEWWSHEIT